MLPRRGNTNESSWGTKTNFDTVNGPWETLQTKNIRYTIKRPSLPLYNKEWKFNQKLYVTLLEWRDSFLDSLLGQLFIEFSFTTKCFHSCLLIFGLLLKYLFIDYIPPSMQFVCFLLCWPLRTLFEWMAFTIF